MVDFDNFVVMQEGFLNKLNIAIDKVIREKKTMNLDYDLMEKALGIMLRNVRSIDRGATFIAIPVKKEEILKITLDFFRSIDSEFHEKAINTILQQSENIKMKIYDLHSIKNFSKKDELGLLEYTPYANVESRNGGAVVHIPTKKELTKRKEKLLNKEEGTLEDLYTIVHEIAHLFDFDLEKGMPDKEELEGKRSERKTRIARELLGEATTIAFENMLSEYLIEKGIYPKQIIQRIDNARMNSNLNDARLVYAKLVLAKEKSKNGEITLEFVENFMRDNGFSIQYIRRMANNIIHDPRDMLFEKRYALGRLIAPTIIRKYKEEGITTLKRYLEEVKNENFEGAMSALGIQLNGEGINQLVATTREWASRINTKEK